MNTVIGNLEGVAGTKDGSRIQTIREIGKWGGGRGG